MISNLYQKKLYQFVDFLIFDTKATTSHYTSKEKKCYSMNVMPMPKYEEFCLKHLIGSFVSQ